MVEPIRRSRLSQQIVVELCRLIRAGYYRPGDRLPPERDLAEQLQVSRASLREALRSLEVSGIVECRHGGGTYVRDGFEDGLFSPLALVLGASDDLVGDLWEVRIIFEPAIAARAAARATEEDIARLETLLAQQAALSAGDLDERVIALDRSFHTEMARVSGNQVAMRVVQLINQFLQEGRSHFITSTERAARAYVCHREIVTALRERQPQVAREAMLRHLREVEEFILGEMMTESERGRSPG